MYHPDCDESEKFFIVAGDRVIFDSMENPQSTSEGVFDNDALPLVVAVTGHRDLLDSEVEGIRERVRGLLKSLVELYPERCVRVMSPLAEGADRLVAEEALALGIDLIAPLPMAKQNYARDFASPESLQQFEDLLDRASESFELPVARGCTTEQISIAGAERNRQYAQLGVFLCAHCHILLVLWDGKHSDELGGTGQVVKFHHDDIMPGYTSKTLATQQILVDDESDLVYHIVCSRDRTDGQPSHEFAPLDCSWFTKDRDNPRSQEIPEQHRLIFLRSSEFSRDSIRFAEQIAAESYPLLEEPNEHELPDGLQDINRIFCIADWLAIYYQKKTILTLRVTHILGFLMGFMFILYSDYKTWPYYMFAFLLFFLIAAAVQYFAKQGGWHRRYLDYRALAEGLRVQFYWAAAGVKNENESKFTHDNFLQTQDPELGWIRNVMRVAGTRCDVAPNRDAAGLNFTLSEWIGDENSGQLGYYRKKVLERLKKSQFTERLGTLSLLTSVGVVVLFVFAGSSIPDHFRDPLLIVMGTMLLLFAVRHGYAFSTAEKELIKQYDFMLRIFYNAKRRLENAEDVDEKRQVLLALGGSALDEHAEWILTHRDRSIDQGEIWRMGS